MESPVLLAIHAGLSRDAHEHLCQLFFERFNVAGFAIVQRPMTQFYAAITGNDLSGVIVDIGQDYTDITPLLMASSRPAPAILKSMVSDIANDTSPTSCVRTKMS